MIDIDEYLGHVARLGRELDPNGETPLDLLKVWDALDSTIRDCIDFRQTVFSSSDEERVSGYVPTGMFPHPDPRRRLAGFAFAFDVHDELYRNGLRRLCAPYELSNALFKGSPSLWEKRRQSDAGRISSEMLNFDGLVQEERSEVVSVPGGYGKLPAIVRPFLVNWLRTTFPHAPFYARLHPDRFHATRPLMTFNESAVAQGRFDDLMKFKMHGRQVEYGEYVLDDCEPGPETECQFMEYRISGIRRLEIRAGRKSPDYLSMMIEELTRDDDPMGMMIGRCVHLDTDQPNGTPIEDVKVAHLDIAINVYEGETRAERTSGRLRDGKITDATFRTHLFRVEGVPLFTVLPICAAFFRSTVLMSEWMRDLQMPGPAGWETGQDVARGVRSASKASR